MAERSYVILGIFVAIQALLASSDGQGWSVGQNSKELASPTQIWESVS